MGCSWQVLPPLTCPGECDGWPRGRENKNKALDSQENQDHDTEIPTGNLTKAGSEVGEWDHLEATHSHLMTLDEEAWKSQPGT